MERPRRTVTIRREGTRRNQTLPFVNRSRRKALGNLHPVRLASGCAAAAQCHPTDRLACSPDSTLVYPAESITLHQPVMIAGRTFRPDVQGSRGGRNWFAGRRRTCPDPTRSQRRPSWANLRHPPEGVGENVPLLLVEQRPMARAKIQADCRTRARAGAEPVPAEAGRQPRPQGGDRVLNRGRILLQVRGNGVFVARRMSPGPRIGTTPKLAGSFMTGVPGNRAKRFRVNVALSRSFKASIVNSTVSADSSGRSD
jgi:hypothetical protein